MISPNSSAAFESMRDSLDDLPKVIGAIHAYPRIPSPIEILGSFAAGAEKVETPFGYFLAKDRDEILSAFEDLMKGAS